jgi:hypothetical protein
MCFSAEVSLATFLIGTIGSYFVYSLGTVVDKIVALFLAYVASMQAIEWILWNHQTCDSFHKNVSLAGMILNASQPIVLGLILLVLSAKPNNRIPLILIMIATWIFAISYTQQYQGDLRCTTPRPNDPHLVWNWTTMKSYKWSWILYITSVVAILLIGMPTVRSGFFAAFFINIGMTTSMLVYPRQDMGAMWCFFAALTPPFYYIARKMGFSIL